MLHLSMSKFEVAMFHMFQMLAMWLLAVKMSNTASDHMFFKDQGTFTLIPCAYSVCRI
jgi:hypothetical protein